MIIRPGGGKGLSAVYAAGRFDKENSYVISELGGQAAVGDVICSLGSDYAVQLGPDGSGRSAFAGVDLTSPLGIGKAWYIRDRETGEVWSICFIPAGDRSDEYQVSYSPGQATISCLRNKIYASLTVATAPEHACEIWRVHIENRSAESRSLSFITYAEPGVGAGLESRYLDKQHLLLARRSLNAMPSDHPDKAGEMVLFHSSTLAPVCYQNERSGFIGEGRTLRNAVQLNQDQQSGSDGDVRHFIGSLTVEIELPIEGEAEFGFTFGVAHSAEQAVGIASALGKMPLVDRVLQSAREAWSERLSVLRVSSSDPAFDALVNTWLPYQAYGGWLAGRTGGVCFDSHAAADSLRTIYPFVAAEPELARLQIASFAASTSASGSYAEDLDSIVTLDPWDLLWLAVVAARYVAETGDLSILQEHVEMRDGPVLTIKEHCERAIRLCFASVSPHSSSDERCLDQAVRMWSLITGGADEFACGAYGRRQAERTELPEQRNLPRRIAYFESASPTLRDDSVAHEIRSIFESGRCDSDAASACALYSLLTEHVLGIVPTYEGLLVNPHLPSSWSGCEVVRRFRGSVYSIRISRSECAAKKAVSIVVDGEPVLGDMIPCFEDGAEHSVDVTVS